MTEESQLQAQLRALGEFCGGLKRWQEREGARQVSLRCEAGGDLGARGVVKETIGEGRLSLQDVPEGPVEGRALLRRQFRARQCGAGT
jgi:hypothetical protein